MAQEKSKNPETKSKNTGKEKTKQKKHWMHKVTSCGATPPPPRASPVGDRQEFRRFGSIQEACILEAGQKS